MESSVTGGEEYYNPVGSEWRQKVDTGQLCRVCANANEYLIPIFDGEGLEHELGMKIQKHLPIKVTETDNLPQQICYQCASTLIAWHDLVISCLEADKKLRELQVEEEGDDGDDDKGVEMFESPSLDSENHDNAVQPSTSDTQNQVSKTPSPKKTSVNKEKKPKLKMVLVKGPPAGTSGQKSTSKTTVAKPLEVAKSKDGANQDSASERCQLSPLSSSATLQHTPCSSRIKLTDEDKCLSQRSCFVGIRANDNSQVASEMLCCVCGLSSAQKCDLEVHHLVSSAACVLNCGLCSKTFVVKDDFLEHIKGHGANAYQGDSVCFYCGMCFSGKSDMDTHVSAVHSENRLHCFQCKEVFQCGTAFSAHMRVHEDLKESSSVNVLTECIVAGSCKSTQNVGRKLRHLPLDVSKKEFTCNLCGKVFTRNFDLKRHMEVHEPHQVYACCNCPKTFKSKGSLREHKMNHISTNVTSAEAQKVGCECRYCGQMISRKYDLNRHMKIVHGPKLFKSRFIFQHRSPVSSTELESEVNKAVKIDVDTTINCAKGDCSEHKFAKLNFLEAHISGDTDTSKHQKSQGKFSCDICGKLYTRKYDVKRHKRTHDLRDAIHKNYENNDSVKIKRKKAYEEFFKYNLMQLTEEDISCAKVEVNGRTFYRCSYCRQHIITRYNYVRHIRIHTGEKPYPCPHCGKQFRIQTLLNRHVNDVHEGIKNYACDICGKKFSSSSARVEHRLIHFDERAFMCHICGKMYKTKACLKMHSRFHKAVGDFECSHCNKSFKTRPSLKSHIMIHTGEKPYACQFCGKCFRTTHELKNHELIHTNTQTFHCTICEKKFSQERYLKNHLRNHRTHITKTI